MREWNNANMLKRNIKAEFYNQLNILQEQRFIIDIFQVKKTRKLIFSRPELHRKCRKVYMERGKK